MERQLKLIWDFRGAGASKTAEHHEKHLKDYIAAHGEDFNPTTAPNVGRTGYSDISDIHSIAFIIVAESGMVSVRDALKPHRGEVYVEH